MISFVDTHCHIHEAGRTHSSNHTVAARWQKFGQNNPDKIIERAVSSGVERMICVGTTFEDSKLSIDFVKNRQNTWASIGIHPHEAKNYANDTNKLRQFSDLLTGAQKIVAIGECGLDYHYEHSPKSDQRAVFVRQVELALQYDLPVIFHVRDAFGDFWKIFDELNGGSRKIRGVIHSFTADTSVLEQALGRGLYVGLNGIMTFTKDAKQLEAAKTVPLNRMLLETDAPFLTPAPHRGKICQPEHVFVTAEFLCKIRGETLEILAATTTNNAMELFKLQ